MSDEENQEEETENQPQQKKPGRKPGSKTKKGAENLNLYIYKVLKQVHPDMGLSKKAMNVLNSFMMDVFERLATEAANAVKYTNKNTLDARAIECATRLCLPGEFAKHAQHEAQKALDKYLTFKQNNK